MRHTSFGDPVVDSVEDDIGLLDVLQEADGQVYAIVEEDPATGKFAFDIVNNGDGESLVTSDPIFDDKKAVEVYLDGFVEDIQDGW